MFTGLIEETSKIIDFAKTSKGAIIKINADFSDDVKIGDSICVNGVCLTVIKIEGAVLSFEISNETLAVSNSSYNTSDIVNLERAMKADGRFDGHIVSGHIDGTAVIKNIINDGFSYKFEFCADKKITKYIVRKGSVTVNGISLTVVDADETSFSVEIIPHTFEQTNLKYVKIGDSVNIETDILARYIEKFLYLNNNNSKISMEMLEENGYL